MKYSLVISFIPLALFMQVIVPIIYTLLLILLIYKMKFFEIPGFSKSAIVSVFIVKIIAGTSVWWIYNYYYQGGDFQNYFNDGNKLFRLLIDNPKIGRAHV